MFLALLFLKVVKTAINRKSLKVNHLASARTSQSANMKELLKFQTLRIKYFVYCLHAS